MSRNEGVSPLRINKTPATSFTKSTGRPLSEIGSTELRRNSSSFNQVSRNTSPAKESSPFRDSASFLNSPRNFWKEQTVSPRSRFDSSENENENSQILSPKRSSIENLKKQSRVKNSSMFAREQQNEYDPSSIFPLDRPLAAGRPLNNSVQKNTQAESGINHSRKEDEHVKGHRRAESQTIVPTFSPTKSSPSLTSLSAHSSPTKSSLISNGRFNSPRHHGDSSIMSEDEVLKHETPRPLRRHAKSVTFDTAPPRITEYEMVTPDPSAASGSREGSYESDEEEDEDELSFDQDDSFDASLEDTDKTPVVLPEDWRYMSPEAANTSLTDVYDDVFDGRDNSPMSFVRPTTGINGSRLGSGNSDADARPLPPVPNTHVSNDHRRRHSSVNGSSGTERAGDLRHSLPQPPPPVGISKIDLLGMRDTSMSLEDRLQLMTFDDERNISTPTLEKHSAKLNEGGVQVQVEEVEVTVSEITLDEPRAPRISRESILRRVRSRNFDDYEEYEFDADFSHDRSYADLADLDPDVPIPSRECSSKFDEHPHEASSNDAGAGEADSIIDAYNFAEMTEVNDTEISQVEVYERDASVIRHPVQYDYENDDDVSQYSPQPEEQPASQSTIDTSGPPTPAALNTSPSGVQKDLHPDGAFSPLEAIPSDLTSDPLGICFALPPSPLDAVSAVGEMRQFLQRSLTPEGGSEDLESDEPRTPDSVIRHPVAISPPAHESSPEIPKREATIRGADERLKTRPSLIPEDVDMTARRRQVSGSHAPPIPERSPNRQSLVLEMGHVDEDDSQMSNPNKDNSMLQLDLGDDSNDLSFGLHREFNHIIEAQKKGYLMRENSKVVVASSRQFSDEKIPPASEAGAQNAVKNDPRKASDERKPAWTKEPWNGKSRRKSIRTTSGHCIAPTDGPAPPLPGQESAVSGHVDSIAEHGNDGFEDGEERGRVFVKVVGVKDLDLPLPQSEQTQFQLTLDNGLHCVTTSWLDLSQSAPIGQEFELVVLDDLEFQLTLQTKLEPPAVPAVTAAPVETMQNKKPHSAFRNLLSSPKKRKEQERKAQEQAERVALQQQQEARAAARRSRHATAWDLLHDLVGPDGSFARAYVCLTNYESEAYGRSITVDVPCFNEWAVDNTASSVKSKRGGVVRRPPYRVGKLTLQLLYIPKPKGAKDDDMPKSMNACIRELKEAEQVKEVFCEGHLSQQGGDCPYWRRRFFRLQGTKLTAYHETTRQPRATINLAKATKLLDDKSALQQPSATKGGGRRKSGFAEDEEGYMFVEEGFRIRFANGEVIDFYADSREQKEAWMNVLAGTVGRDTIVNKGWTAMVFEKERKDRAAKSKATAAQHQTKSIQEKSTTAIRPPHHRTQSLDPRTQDDQLVPSSPVKGPSKTQSQAPMVPRKDVPRAQAPVARVRSSEKTSRRDQVRSMVF